MDRRFFLLQRLERYTPTAEELVAKQTIIDFVHAHPDCFERTLLKGHITASALLVNKDNTHILLMHHAKLHKWVQLGGHCDGNPDVLAVALKEAQEESGIAHIEPVMSEIFDLDVHRVPERAHEPVHYHYDIRFLLRVISDEKVVQNNESHALQWFGAYESFFPTNERTVTRLYEKWRALL